VYSFGSNEFGNVGTGKSAQNENLPQKIHFENKIIKIFGGCNCEGAFFYSGILFFNFFIQV
jgi:alpha-tubulin suppressor-like RCC1 family protein